VGNRAQLLRIGEPTPHPRHDRETAVFLDVGVHPLVDEARLRVVAILARPGAKEIIVERGTAGRTAAGRLPAELLHDRRHRFSSFEMMKARTSSWVRSMHLHMSLRPAAAV